MIACFARLMVLLAPDDPGAATAVAGLARALGAETPLDYDAVVREALARMVRVAERYVGNRDDAWDCAQEALILAIRKFDQFQGRSQISSWLHRIVVNCALAHLRRRSKRSEVNIDDLLPTFDDQGFAEHPFAPPQASAEDLIERDDARRLVRAAIDVLPETHRTVLLMRDIEEMSMKEIAEALSLTENAIKVRIHRARTALKRQLQPLMTQGRI